MPDLVDRITRDIQQRIRELEPLVAEARRLQQALDALDGGAAAPSPPAARRRPRVASARTRAPRGHNRRAILDALGATPRTAGDIRTETGISRTTVASTLSKLVADGHAAKAERGYVARAGGDAPAADHAAAGAD